MSDKPSIDSIFCSAIEIESPDERRALIEQVCGEDVDLKHQVERLLHAHFHGRSILDAPVQPVATVDELPMETAGTVIGRYKLLEQIGEGGMGTVWMAQQQEPVKRLVAVKLVKAGMDSKQVIARFEAERQALALMDHPNIARVLDAGATSAQRPYFVMDLVKGVPITWYCDEHRLTLRQRLGLFIPVCQAVQHAHQKGIIHRDLKPSNVLVALYDGKPVPKVIDFGVAKAAGQSLTQKTLVTGFGNIVGTLEYMSSEQAELNNHDVDTRSDIYSLGVLLYELLSGTTPLEHKRVKQSGMLEALRIIRDEEAPTLSNRLATTAELPAIAASRGLEPAKLAKLVRGELNWIVMKALEKDRNCRYETANGFAMDVQRYLADEPVLAGPPSARYRLRKLARRNKGGLAVAALVLFFLVLLGSGVGWAVRDRSAKEAEATQQRAARQANVVGQVESIFADVDRLEGEQKWPEALVAARRAEAAVSGGEADPATAQRVRERLWDLEFIDRLEQIRMKRAITADSKDTQRQYARAFRDYGVDVEALAAEVSIERLKAHPLLVVPLAAALDDWVRLLLIGSERDAAGWKPLVAVARGIDPEPLRDRLRSIWGRPVSETRDEVRRLAESIDIRAHHPATVLSLARTLRQRQLLDASIRILRDAQFAYPGDFWLNVELGVVLLGMQKDREGAVRFLTAATAIRPNAIIAHRLLGLALSSQKKLDEAAAAFREVVRIDTRDPSRSRRYLGKILTDQKKLDEAVACYKEAIELDPNPAWAYFELGQILRTQNKLEEARACFCKAIKLDPQYSAAHVGLGHALYAQGKLEDAMVAYQEAIKLDPKNADTYRSLGALLCDGLRQYDKAIECFQTALELNPRVAHASDNLRVALVLKGWDLINSPEPERRDPTRAIETVQKAIKLDSLSSEPWLYLGWVQYRLGHWRASIEALERSCKLHVGGRGDAGQWIVLALAHAKLAAQKDLPEKERAHHQAEAHRWFEQADKEIDAWWRVRPGHICGEAIWDFRAEARELMKSQGSGIRKEIQVIPDS
jgi:tetratricopeptide (TPR) repeat protein